MRGCNNLESQHHVAYPSDFSNNAGVRVKAAHLLSSHVDRSRTSVRDESGKIGLWLRLSCIFCYHK